jgi:hypothetical protein
LIGLVLAVIGALAWRSSVQRYREQAFQTAATEVSETAQTLLRRDTDFVGALSTVLTRQPELRGGAFSQWYTELEGWERQAGGLGTIVVRSMPAGHVSSFLARRDAEPTFQVLIGGNILPVTEAGRSRDCLISTGESMTSLDPMECRLWCV